MFSKFISFVKDLRSRSFSGQAIAEYWPTVPAAVMLGLLAGQFLTGALVPLYEAIVESVYAAQENNIQPVDVEEDTGLVCVEEEPEDVVVNAPWSITLDSDYTIELTSYAYDPDADTTSLTYRVINGTPAISHWMILKPDCVALEALKQPVLEVTGGNSREVQLFEDGEDGSTGWVGWKIDEEFEETPERTFVFTFNGHYTITASDVGVKAGGLALTGTVMGLGCEVTESTCEPTGGEEPPAEEPPAEEPPAEEPPAEEEVWDKSSVEVSGASCNSNAGKVEFTVKNTGTEPMDGTTDWRFYENGEQIETGTLQLGGSESTTLNFSVTKKTTSKFRLEVDQRPGHPGSSVPQADVECE